MTQRQQFLGAQLRTAGFVRLSRKLVLLVVVVILRSDKIDFLGGPPRMSQNASAVGLCD